MATPATTVELLAQVLALGLCDQSRLTGSYSAERPLPDSPTELVKHLVRAGLCTRYQGRMILAGKGRRLVLGKYRLLRPLGKGGGGSVYLGEHTDLRRQVAVKVQRNAGDDPLVAERFRREARSAAALDHPNIVKLYDFGLSNGVPYLVMEFVPGVTLQRLMDTRGRLDVPAAVHVVTQVALGLAHAHARGIVHRDVKPLNLMVTPDGGVKVLDMGLARALDRGEDRLTEQAADATICGTIDYLSPEQCVGISVDGRSDIYNLGVLLFALLAGRLPFLGSAAEKVAQHQSAAPPLLEEVAPTVPPALARVVDRMLAKRSGERFQTCHAVIDALAPWCPPATPVFGLIDSQKTLNIRTGHPPTTEWSEGESRRTTARRWGRVKWLAVGVTVLVAAAVVALGVTLTTRPADVVPSAEPWAGECQWLVGNEAPVNDLVFTPDGRYLVGVDWDGRAHVWDVNTGRHLHSTLLKADTAALACAVGASGRVYAAGRDMGVFVIDPESGRAERVIDLPHSCLWTVRPTADERRLLLAGVGMVEVWDVKTATRLTSYTAGGYIWVAALSPDESVVAAGGGIENDFEGPGVIHLWDAATATERLTLTGHTKPVRSISFSPDGRNLYSAGFDGTVRVWDTVTGECLRVIEAHAGYVERVVPVSGGRLLTVAAPPKAWSGVQPMLKLWAADGAEVPGGPPADDRHLYAAAISPDRTRFAASANSNTVRLWAFHPPP